MNKIIYTLLKVITFNCISINTIAESAAEISSTSGDIDCGNWVLDKEESKGKGWYSTANQNWLRGFLSGFALSSRVNILKDVNDASLILWVDNYCHANPLAALSDAGVYLFHTLQAKKSLK